MVMNRDQGQFPNLNLRQNVQGTSSAEWSSSGCICGIDIGRIVYRRYGECGLPELYLYDNDTGLDEDARTGVDEWVRLNLKADVCSSDAADCVRLGDIRIGEDPNVDFENSDELDSFLNRFIAETKQKEV